MGFLLIYCGHYQQLSWLVTVLSVLVPNPILNAKIGVAFEVLNCLNKCDSLYNSPCKKALEN